MKKIWILALFLLPLLVPSGTLSKMDKDDLLQIRELNRQRLERIQEAIRSAKQPIKLEVEGQEDFDVTYYCIDLDVDVKNQLLDGSVTVRANSLISDLNEITLNFYDEIPVTSVTGNASVFTHADNLVIIGLDHAYNAGQSFEVVVSYSGHPWEGILGLSFVSNAYTYQRTLVYTECSPFFARAWWPCKDTPADKADSVDLFITLPNDLILASNGLLLSVTDIPGQRKRWHWHEGYPIATYLVSITAYPYQTFSDSYEGLQGQQMNVDYFVYPQDYNKAAEDFGPTVEMIGFFASKYSEYPFIDEKYGMAEYTGTYAAMEHQTCTSFYSGWITGNHEHETTIAHELSHHWWGNSVSLGSWHDMWLKEGFACYSEALWWEYLYGPYGLQEYMTTARNALDLTGSVYRYDITRQDQIVVSEAYDKGAWVMHMLRYVFGDDTFFQLLPQIYERYAFGNYVTEEFQNTCEEMVDQDLDWFFDEWVYDVWHPQYYWGWSSKDIGASYEVSGFVDQIQEDGPIFTMPLDMAIVTAGGDTIIVTTILVDEQSYRYQFTVEDEPVDVLLDPYDWVLKEQSVITAPFAKYASHRVDDSGENEDGRVDPGETVNVIVNIENIGVDVFGLSTTLSSSDSDIEITSTTSQYGDMIHGATTGNSESPFTLQVSPDAETHIITFRLTFQDQNGYTGVDSFYLTVGTPTVLLVDDDGGEELEHDYLHPLAAKAIPFQVWDVFIEGSPGDTLEFFDVVVWFTGAERENTLTAADQVDIATYLDAGGRLFLSGQDIGHDLAEMGHGPEFFTEYLHASFVSDVTTEYFLQGVHGDPITGQFGLFQLSGLQESPDVIAPAEGANITLEYSPTGNAAGIKYGGNYRLVYFSVGFEGLRTLTGPSEPMRADVLNNIIAWLQFQPSKGDVTEDGSIDILDVLWTVNILLGVVTATPSQEWAADFNEDGKVDILDAIQIVNVILNPPQE